MPGRRGKAAADPLLAIGCREAVPIASGGSSVVYRAYQEAFDRVVAVKVLTAPIADERIRRRFQRELSLAGRLSGHPNVATVFASGFLGDGHGYVLMEYCPAGSLADRLATGPLPVQEVLSIGVKMCGVLELAAREAIVHRDVKPANVLRTRFGEPALSDFGVAVAMGETTGTTQALTPAHAAPEVLESRQVGPAADQWSLASTLHTLLARRPPFAGREGEGLLTSMLRVLSDPVPVIPRSDVPGELQESLWRAMAKSPEDRWPSAVAFGRSLQAIERSAGWPETRLPIEEDFPGGRENVPIAAPPPDETTTPGLRHLARGGGPDGAGRPRAGGPDGAGRPREAGPDGVARPRSGAPDGSARTEPPPAGSGAGGTAGIAQSTAQPGNPPPPVVAPVSDEKTRAWARRQSPDVVVPEHPSPPRRWWWIAGAGGVIVAAALVAVLLLTTSSTPKSNTRAPRLLAPSPALATNLAPRNVEVVNEQPTTATLRWIDPSAGLYPFVVRVSNGSLQTAQSNTQTVVTGLDPTRGYCFVVGAVYGVGGQIANAPPVCIRGGTM